MNSRRGNTCRAVGSPPREKDIQDYNRRQRKESPMECLERGDASDIIGDLSRKNPRILSHMEGLLPLQWNWHLPDWPNFSYDKAARMKKKNWKQRKHEEGNTSASQDVRDRQRCRSENEDRDKQSPLILVVSSDCIYVRTRRNRLRLMFSPGRGRKAPTGRSMSRSSSTTAAISSVRCATTGARPASRR